MRWLNESGEGGVAKGKTKRRARKERITVCGDESNDQSREQELSRMGGWSGSTTTSPRAFRESHLSGGEPERMLEKLTARANKASEYDELWFGL